MKTLLFIFFSLSVLTSCSNNQNSISQIEEHVSQLQSTVTNEEKISPNKKAQICKSSGELKALGLAIHKKVALEDLAILNKHQDTPKTKKLSKELKEIISFLSKNEMYYKRPACNTK